MQVMDRLAQRVAATACGAETHATPQGIPVAIISITADNATRFAFASPCRHTKGRSHHEHVDRSAHSLSRGER